MTWRSPSEGPTAQPPRESQDAVAAELQQARRILLLTHENPDGDGIGSALALRLALLALGKDAEVALAEKCPNKFEFLPGAQSISTDLVTADHDCVVALDCDGPKRLAQLEGLFAAAPRRVNVDHHQSECAFGDVNWCDGTKAAVALMVYELVGRLGVAVSPEIATCLYCGLLTDTGVFRFQNTTSEVLHVAGELVAAGADPTDISRRVWDEIPLPKARLLGAALGNMRTLNEGAVVMAALEQADFERAGALAEHTDGIIDELKRIGGAEVVVLLREQDANDWRVSMRSRSADVASICRGFGGGGHRVAAGCELQGALADVLNVLATEVSRIL